MKLSELLHNTIKTFELQRRIELDDNTFDAFVFLSKKIGHKNPSTLRKMCENRAQGTNVAKLGVEEAIIIMSITNDYRLYEYIKEQLKKLKQESQLSLFAVPLRNIGGNN